MRKSFVFLVVFAFPLLCQQAKEEKKCTFQGQVINGATNEPVRKAELTLIPVNMAGTVVYMNSVPSPVKGSYSATTEATGKFVFENVEPGVYFLSGQKLGFLANRYGSRGSTGSGMPLTVTAGQVLKDLLIKLTPQGTISGRVFDDEGEPVQYVSVQAMTERTVAAGKKAFMPSSSASTNDRGEYRLANITPGKYILMAAPGRMGMPAPPKPANGKPETGFISVYFPSVTEQSQAAKVDVAPGAEITGHDIRLQKSRVVRVKGKVVDGLSGAPAKNVMVSLMPRESFTFNRNMAMLRGDDGQFELANVAPGPYTLSVSNSSGEIRTTASQPIDVGENDVEGIVVILKPGQNVTGSVVVVDKKGDEKVSLGTMRISLSPYQQGVIFGSIPSDTVKDDGSFVLPGAFPGKYSVSVYGTPQDSYVASVKLGSQELPDRLVDWSLGIPTENLQITISMKVAQVTGRVEQNDGNPMPGAIVVLVPEDEVRRKQAIYHKRSVSDQTGNFTVKGIPPGEYKAYAWEQLESGANMDPEFMKAIESKGVRVKLNGGDSQAVQLKLIPPAL